MSDLNTFWWSEWCLLLVCLTMDLREHKNGIKRFLAILSWSCSSLTLGPTICGPRFLGGGSGSRNFHILRTRTRFGGRGGGGSGRIFSGDCRCRSIKFGQFREICLHFRALPGDLEITRHFLRLTQITGHLAGLLKHSKNVTTSINWTQKSLPKVWGGHGPPWLRHWSKPLCRNIVGKGFLFRL